MEKTAILLHNHLDEDCFNIRFILNGDGPFAEELSDAGADVEVIQSEGRYSPAWHRKLQRSLANQPADVVQLHLSRLNAPLLHQSGAKIIERLNMTRHKSFRYPLRWRWLDNLTANWIDKFIVVSESLKQDFIFRGYKDSKIDVIHNGIDIPENVIPVNLKEEFGIPENHWIIGTLARLTEQKGINTFLDTAYRISGKFDNVHFMIAGEGELRSRLEHQAESLNINSKVHFLDFRKEGLNTIAAYDIFMYLSRWEPFANTILEALAAGTPVIASNIGGNREALQDHHNGLLVPPEDPISAAECATAIMADESLKNNLIANGKESLKLFTIEKMVTEHSRLYELIHSELPVVSSY